MFLGNKKAWVIRPKTFQFRPISTQLAPSVKRLVFEYNINPDTVKSTGCSKKLLKGDVINFIKEKNLAAQKRSLQWPTQSTVAQPPKVTSSPSSSISNGKNQIPHQYLSQDFAVEKISLFVTSLNKNNIAIKREDVLLKCVALSLKEVGDFNVYWNDIQLKTCSNSTISVGIVNKDGQFYEIDNAEIKGFQDIVAEKKQLLDKPPVQRMSTFSLYDFGSHGIRSFVPIIRSPQSAVLSVGGERKKLIMDPVLRWLEYSTLSLSFDGRCIDFEVASKFLQRVAYYFENPNDLLL